MKYLILILSNQPFDSYYKTNKWHVATTLAKKGHKVIFVDPPLRFKALKSFAKKPSFDLTRLFFLTRNKRNGLVLYSPANFFNFWPFSILNTSLHSKNLNLLLNKYRKRYAKTILWIYHFDYPDLENLVKKVDHDLMIYDCVDEYAAFPEYAQGKFVNNFFIRLIQRIDNVLKVQLNQSGLSGKKWVLHRERWLSNTAGLLFVSAPGLVKKFKKWEKIVSYLPNATDYKTFDIDIKKTTEPLDLRNIPHPRIGFVGAIDAYKNNISLIEKTVKTYPNFHFVMIGSKKHSDPDLDLSKLESMPNIHFLGSKPWKDLPMYYAHFDVFFIPYNLNDYTIGGCFPVKYFEAMAVGLPVVVTNMPAYADFDVDGYVSKTDDEFVKNIKKAMIENSALRIQKRKKMAEQNTWVKKVRNQLQLIDTYFAKKQ